MFPDVPPALRAWRDGFKRSYIYSSGSREAQRLLFANAVSADGGAKSDLRPWLCGYFDTKVGPKMEPRSYADICESVGVDEPARVLFATDSVAEAVAARGAGLQAGGLLRGYPLIVVIPHRFAGGADGSAWKCATAR